jgi:hypothetical protein
MVELFDQELEIFMVDIGIFLVEYDVRIVMMAKFSLRLKVVIIYKHFLGLSIIVEELL